VNCKLSRSSLSQLNHFKVFQLTGFYVKPDKGTHGMPSMPACCTGIDVQAIQRRIRLNFQNV
jgi:hypothetical protein